MNRKRSRATCGCSVRTAVASALALASLAILQTGCIIDNRLPYKPVPKLEIQARALPGWYPEAPWTVKEGKSQIFIEGKIVFDTNKATIRAESEKVLQTLHQFLTDHTEVTRLRIEGHTDAKASDEHNQKLSAERALSVCNWLVDHGIAHTRLIAVGFGESKPIAPNEVAEGRAENRRTEFHVAEVNGRPFLGKDPTAGGMMLDVLSIEQRQLEKQQAERPEVAPAPPVFKPTGNEVKEVKPTAPNQPVVVKDKKSEG